MDGHRGGWIEIIAGGMFSGKSEELIRRLRRSVIARQRVQLFKPCTDDRYATAQELAQALRAIPRVSPDEPTMLTRLDEALRLDTRAVDAHLARARDVGETMTDVSFAILADYFGLQILAESFGQQTRDFAH